MIFFGNGEINEIIIRLVSSFFNQVSSGLAVKIAVIIRFKLQLRTLYMKSQVGFMFSFTDQINI